MLIDSLNANCNKLKPEAVDEYKRIHAAVWPAILSLLTKHHIVDYSIHHYPPLQLLIANFKYTGNDYAADMREMAKSEETKEWWKVTDGMQESFQEGATGSVGAVPWWTVRLVLRVM